MEIKMTDFFPGLLERFTGADFLENVYRKYHYGEAQKAEVQAVAEEMLPLMRREAFWVSREFPAQKRRRAENEDDVSFEKVVISLGGGIDALQEGYSEREMLSQSYMIEALAGEALLQSYEAYNRYVGEHTKLHVARYHFPGSEEAFPLEMLSGLLKELTDKVTCNAAFCMQPKKSVVFISELTRDERVHCRGICVGCDSARCPNRVPEDSPRERILARMADLPLSYGYSRIFGSSFVMQICK